MNSTKGHSKNIFLADDDDDDCMLFEEALREVCLETTLTTAKDGHQLMQILDKSVPPPPDLIFLDLNMPRKNGFECLDEIKGTPKYKDIPIVIFSTSAQADFVNKVYQKGAQYYIRKPGTFSSLKSIIQQVLSMDWHDFYVQPPKDKFLLQP